LNIEAVALKQKVSVGLVIQIVKLFIFGDVMHFFSGSMKNSSVLWRPTTLIVLDIKFNGVLKEGITCPVK